MNMFSFTTKPIIALVVLSLLATLAAATPAVVARTGGGGGSSCAPSTSLQCCQHVGTYSQVLSVIPLPALFGLLSLLVTLFGTIDLALNAVLGITCSGIAVGGSCNAQTVCCENVAFSGLVNVGCTAIDIL